MAEVSATPLQDYGNLMSSFGQGQATIAATQAQAGLTGQQTQLAAAQTQGAQIANTQAQMQLKLFQSGLNGLLVSSATGSDDQSGVSLAGDGSSGSATGDKPFDPAAVDAGLRQRFYVNPAGTPQQQKQIQMAALSGNKGFADFATSQRDLGVQSQLAANQRDSGILYDGMSAVSSAPPGQAMDALEAVNPAAAAQIKSNLPDAGAEDSAARQLADHVAASVHQYTGRKVVADSSGTYRDEITGQPVTGLPQAGLSTAQWMEISKDAYSLVDVKNTDGSTSQVPKWSSPGQNAASPADWIKKQAFAKTGAAGASPTMSGAPAAQANSAANAAAKLGAKQAPPVAGSSDPQMNTALADPSYKLSSQPDLPTPQAGKSPSTTQAAALQDVASSRAATYKDTQGMIAAQQQSLTFYKAAQQILVNPNGYTPGALNSILAQAKRWVPGYESLDTSDYQQVVKYLSNAAIQSAAQIFPKMTDSAKKLALTTLNPNAAQTPTALNEMVKTNMANSQYVIDTANRFKTYNMAGGDPRSFYDWNRQYFPQEQAVVPAKGTLPAAAQARLKEGTHTTFGNGQVWTLQGGKPVQVQ